jgi:hypothetical protein
MPVDPLIEMTRRLDRLERYLDDQKRFGPAFKSVAADPFMFNRLHGWWTFGNNDNTTIFDLSGMGRHLTMNGGVFSSTYNNNIAYLELDGSNDYASRADEAGLDITGAVCLGGWFWFDTANAGRLIGKGNNTLANTAYLLTAASGPLPQFSISDGATFDSVGAAASVSTLAWHFIVGRYTPSTEIAVFVDGVKATNTTGINASIQNIAGAFTIGADFTPAVFLDGRAALCFLCSSDLTDTVLRNFYERTKPIFQTI